MLDQADEVAANESSKPARAKRARFDESSNSVTVFLDSNPAVHVKSTEAVDLKPLLEAEAREAIQARFRHQQLTPERQSRDSGIIHDGKESNVVRQAFHLFQIPVVVDSKYLNRKELAAELRIRGLRVTGTKDQLVRRLDHYIREVEPKRVRGE